MARPSLFYLCLIALANRRLTRAVFDGALLDIGLDRLRVFFREKIGEARHAVILQHAAAHDVLEMRARIFVPAPQVGRDAGADDTRPWQKPQ